MLEPSFCAHITLRFPHMLRTEPRQVSSFRLFVTSGQRVEESKCGYWFKVSEMKVCPMSASRIAGTRSVERRFFVT
jgi:hypothetical protein